MSLDAVDAVQFNVSLLLIILTGITVDMLIQKAAVMSKLTVITAEMQIHRYIVSEIIHTTLQIKLLILTFCSISSESNIEDE